MNLAFLIIFVSQKLGKFILFPVFRTICCRFLHNMSRIVKSRNYRKVLENRFFGVPCSSHLISPKLYCFQNVSFLFRLVYFPWEAYNFEIDEEEIYSFFFSFSKTSNHSAPCLVIQRLPPKIYCLSWHFALSFSLLNFQLVLWFLSQNVCVFSVFQNLIPQIITKITAFPQSALISVSIKVTRKLWILGSESMQECMVSWGAFALSFNRSITLSMPCFFFCSK